ncbi:MAG TPA: hypothetical protein VL651_15930 [Bacteroidia bacterium]|jgi:hypothetical protein|nr:hypothetical protein [Bacteroidia bacterium]
MPRSTPLTDKHFNFFSSETPEEKKDMHRFFISTYAIAAGMFFITALVYYLLLPSSFIHDQIYAKRSLLPDGLRLRPFFLLGLGLVVLPLFNRMAFFRVTRGYLTSILFIFPLVVGFYTALFCSLCGYDLLGPPLLSSGTGFALTALIGIAAEKLFYLKIVGYLKFFIGFGSMLAIHTLMKSDSIMDWFVAVPIFWTYDFISSDSKKLYHIPKIKNPELDNVQQLLISTIAIVVMVPLWRRGDQTFLLQGRVKD